jgi:hypothetical protein
MSPPEEPITPERITASDRGAGTLGFAGAAAKRATALAQGLAHLDSGEFDGAPREPMLPGTWNDRLGPERP